MTLARERRGDCATSTPIQLIFCLRHQPNVYYTALEPIMCQRLLREMQGQLQPDQVAQQWHEAAARTQAHVPHGSRISSPSVVIHSGQPQMSSASRRRFTRSDNTHRSLSRRRIRYVWQVLLLTRSEPIQPSSLCYCRNPANKTVFHGTYRRLDQSSCHRQLISGLVSKT